MSKAKPKKRSNRAMEELAPLVATLQPNALKVAVSRVEEAQYAVEEGRNLCAIWERQLQGIRERIMELDKESEEVRRQLADAQGLLQAKESKLCRELEALRSASYNVEVKSAWDCKTLDKAQCEKVSCY